MNQTYRELQELSFQYINPGVTPCCRRQSSARGNRRDLVDRIRREVEQAFAEAGMVVEVFGREKTIFSIYHKMIERT